MLNARLIAFYLPQYHPIPENDKWWGKGFTEWTNVTKAKSLYPGHHQPNLPADLGFYDLRVPEARVEQAELARQHGIEGFCYWHYWFGNGRRILERPFQEVLDSGEPDFPFCLGWANESWTGIWHGASDKILIEQKYPGEDDYKEHFYALLNAFKDSRYITVDDKKLFLIYKPQNLPDQKQFLKFWRDLAARESIGDFFFVGVSGRTSIIEQGFDGVIPHMPHRVVSKLPPIKKEKSLWDRLFSRTQNENGPKVYDYKDCVNSYLCSPLSDCEYPVVLPNWDNTPRSGLNGMVLQNSTPELFGEMLNKALDCVEGRGKERKLIFVKSWNEWAEGNYLEPDRRFGRMYLQTVAQCLLK